MKILKVSAAYAGGLALGLLCAWLSLLLGLRTFLLAGLAVYFPVISGLSMGVYKLSSRGALISWFCGVATSVLIAAWFALFVLVPFSQTGI